MSIFPCDSDFEVIPSLDEVKVEISGIVGLSEIKNQLEAVVDKIIDAENDARDGFRVVPPKPFHMVFIGNCGTGKSMVARILGKLFYLAGVLTSFTVTEIQGSQKVKKGAGGGILLVNIDEEDVMKPKTLDEIIELMDEGDTSVIFAGNYGALNQFMKHNNELYRRFSTRLQFDDLTCEDLAEVLLKKASNKEVGDLIYGFEMDVSCTPDNVARMIAEFTPETLRSLLNSHLLDQMLIEAKKHCESQGAKLISLLDLGRGIQNGALVYKKLLNL